VRALRARRFLQGLPVRMVLPWHGSLLPVFRHASEAGEREDLVIAGSPLGISALGVLSVDGDCREAAAAARGGSKAAPAAARP